MRAEIITVGTELLLGQIVDTHSAYLSRACAELGISVYFHSTVGDNRERLKETLRLAGSRSDLVLIAGGLGPTEDDLTRRGARRGPGLAPGGTSPFHRQDRSPVCSARHIGAAWELLRRGSGVRRGKGFCQPQRDGSGCGRHPQGGYLPFDARTSPGTDPDVRRGSETLSDFPAAR